MNIATIDIVTTTSNSEKPNLFFLVIKSYIIILLYPYQTITTAPGYPIEGSQTVAGLFTSLPEASPIFSFLR